MTNQKAERQLVAKIKEGPPKNREEALKVFALMMATGRVKKPSSGGPTPRPKSAKE